VHRHPRKELSVKSIVSIHHLFIAKPYQHSQKAILCKSSILSCCCELL